MEGRRQKLLENQIEGDWFPWKYESYESTTQRINIAKRKINEIIKNENLQDEEILIVSHGGTLSDFTKVGDEKRGKHFKNAEIVSYDQELKD